MIQYHPCGYIESLKNPCNEWILYIFFWLWM